MIKRLLVLIPITFIVAALAGLGFYAASTKSAANALLAAPTVPVQANAQADTQPTKSATPAVSRTVTLTRTPTPLASLTPSQTLLPPPTFEPPTLTPLPSALPTATATFTPIGLGSIPGLIGAETYTPVGTPGCVIRKAWKATYTVQFNEALITIAKKFNVTVAEMAQANCLADPNKIYLNQVLHVPGELPPTPPYTCFPVQVLTPINNTYNIPGSGLMEFHWYGPRTPRNLVRIFAPDGTKTEYVVELRQDYQIDLSTLPQAGMYQWWVYPLDASFVQTCPEGGPWNFTKAAKPPATRVGP